MQKLLALSVLLAVAVTAQAHSLTFGDRASYCVTSQGGSTEPTYHQLAVSSSLADCVSKVSAGGYHYMSFWSNDGRCRGMSECPYEYDCTSRSCSSYDQHVKTYTLAEAHLQTLARSLKPKPVKPVQLYIVSGGPDTLLLHSGLWGLAYAENAKRAGIKYTVYYEDFPGMKVSTLGQVETRKVDGQKFNYHSSSTWHAEVIKQDKALHPAGWKAAPFLPNSLTEHVAFACYVTGLSCPLPAFPVAGGAEADVRGTASKRLFDGKIAQQTQTRAFSLSNAGMLALVLACVTGLAVALRAAAHATKDSSQRRLIEQQSDIELLNGGIE